MSAGEVLVLFLAGCLMLAYPFYRWLRSAYVRRRDQGSWLFNRPPRPGG